MRERRTNSYGLRCLFMNDGYAWHNGDGDPVDDVRKATMPASRAYLLFSSDDGKLHKAYVERGFDKAEDPQAAFIIVSAELMDKQA